MDVIIIMENYLIHNPTTNNNATTRKSQICDVKKDQYKHKSKTKIMNKVVVLQLLLETIVKKVKVGVTSTKKINIFPGKKTDDNNW